jgi:muconate cycloisomerase
MEITQVKIYPVQLPFSADFSHSLRKRSWVKNIVVEVVAEQDNLSGYGEGAPRSYVTGESQDSTITSISGFTKIETFPWNLNDVSQIWDLINSLSNGNKQNAAICAIETALLDLLGKHQKKNIIEYFPKHFHTDTVYYGATIPLDNQQRVSELCQLCKKMNIKKLRMKMGKDFEQNRETIEIVKDVFGNDYDLRVDVNGAWTFERALKHFQLLKDYKIKVIEQPMMPDDSTISNLAKLTEKNGFVLMADESACTLKDAEKIHVEGYYKMVNIRLSKCGGFRNTLKIIDYLRSNGMKFQIGCHLGESGILSAAGRALCLLCKDAVYYDGSYDEYLLKENTTQEDVSFGIGGKGSPLEGPGLGVNINHHGLKCLCGGFPPVIIQKP